MRRRVCTGELGEFLDARVDRGTDRGTVGLCRKVQARRMCQRVFLGSDRPLPLVELAAAGDEFQVRAVTDDRGVRDRLGVACLVEVVTEQGCACDFNVPSNEVMVATFPGDADGEASLARAVSRARRLHEYVIDALARGPVAAYVCWWDEEQAPPAGTRDVEAEWFLRPALDEVDRHVMRVRP